MGMSSVLPHLNGFYAILRNYAEVFYMFYENLQSICDKKGLKITNIVLECGGAKGSVSNWKKGAVPNSDIVMKLSMRLDVSTDCLLFGHNHSDDENNLSNDERKLLNMYRELSDTEKTELLGNLRNQYIIGNNTSVQGNQSINISTQQSKDNELMTLIESLPIRERSKLITMIYDYVDTLNEK